MRTLNQVWASQRNWSKGMLEGMRMNLQLMSEGPFPRAVLTDKEAEVAEEVCDKLVSLLDHWDDYNEESKEKFLSNEPKLI